ncbi:MAG: hypothetical protein M3N97_14805 [Pseudomonadota bacterium]|nr:hypothetical protein [Pseudomonadota bacterium]
MPPEYFALRAAVSIGEGRAEAQRRLERVADCLELNDLLPEAQAVRDYVRDAASENNRRFEIVPNRRPPGRPEDVLGKLRRGQELDDLLFGRTWRQVADELSRRGRDADETTLRREHREWLKLCQQLWSAPLMTAEQAGDLLDLVGPPPGLATARKCSAAKK